MLDMFIKAHKPHGRLSVHQYKEQIELKLFSPQFYAYKPFQGYVNYTFEGLYTSWRSMLLH